MYVCAYCMYVHIVYMHVCAYCMYVSGYVCVCMCVFAYIIEWVPTEAQRGHWILRELRTI